MAIDPAAGPPVIGISRSPTSTRGCARRPTGALGYEPLLSDDMACCMSADHPLSREVPIDVVSLSDEVFVAPYDCVCRDALMHG